MKNIKTFRDFSITEGESGWYPAGTEFDPSAPWNQSDANTVRGIDLKPGEIKFDLIGSDFSELALLKKKDDGKMYAMMFDPSSDEFRDYMEVEREFVGRDEDGDPEFEYAWENAEVDDDAILGYASDKAKFEGLGSGMDDFENDTISLVDPEIASLFSKVFGRAKEELEKTGKHTSFLYKDKYKNLVDVIEAVQTYMDSQP